MLPEIEQWYDNDLLQMFVGQVVAVGLLVRTAERRSLVRSAQRGKACCRYIWTALEIMHLELGDCAFNARATLTSVAHVKHQTCEVGMSREN